MPDAPTPRPDSKRMFDMLVGLKMDPGSAFTFVQEVENMASANLIARFESKLDSTRWLLVALVAIFGTTMLGIAAGIFYLIVGK